MKDLRVKILTIFIFSMAMGLLESAVVIYLREIYYPHGFRFPMVTISGKIALTELLRELATMIMLLTIAILSGKTIAQKLAWFIFSFAVWDIFYYVFLKILIGWPESLWTWDILFLIPTVWVGHVFEPVLLSLIMVLFSFIILIFSEKNLKTKIIFREWAAIILGSVFIIISFTMDYSKFYFEKYKISDLFISDKFDVIRNYLNTFIPRQLEVEWFGLGLSLILIGIVEFYIRNRKILKKNFEN